MFNRTTILESIEGMYKVRLTVRQVNRLENAKVEAVKKKNQFLKMIL
jgi:hypothetical protein